MYKDLTEFLDLEKFQTLQEEIHTGFAQTRHLALNGTWTKQLIDDTKTSVPTGVKLISQAMQEFMDLPDDDILKIKGLELYKNNFNQFSTYLKLVIPSYDSYQYYILYDKETRNEELISFFPDTYNWIKNSIEYKVFKKITKVFFIVCEANGISWEHKDLESSKDFVYIRSSLEKPTYIWDDENKVKTYINSRAAWWDINHWVGGERIFEQTYALKIEGEFSDEVAKEIT